MTNRTHSPKFALSWRNVALTIAALILFVVSLGIMREGAGSLAPIVRGHLAVTNVLDSLGFGWLTAYLILSGSPAATAALALLSAHALSPAQAFSMITGSRLGASFVILVIGFIYTLRGHERRQALTTGILCFILTGSVQLLTLPVGILILKWGWFAGFRWSLLERLPATIDSSLAPLMDQVIVALPGWLLFAIGIGLTALSFQLFDKAVPKLNLASTELGQVHHLVYQPGIMFLMGLVITVLTMSVSISIGILVPLSARGYIRRENLIPYILGANISTLVDTLMASVLLGDPRAVTVVLIHMISAIFVSLPIILLIYRPFQRAASDALVWINRTRKNFVLFVSAIFVIPIMLMLL